jgi:hypothetical protein
MEDTYTYPQGNQIERLLIAPYAQQRLKNQEARGTTTKRPKENLIHWASVARIYVQAIW